MKKSTAYLNGVRVALPVILGYLPVAIAFAVMASEAGFSRLEIIAMSTLVFAGASQIMAVGMIATGASMLSVVVATFVLNLRHFIMGSYIMKRLGKTSTIEKLTTANGITDEAFAIIGTTEDEKCSVPYLFGIITVTYGSWVVGTALGAFVSMLIPASLSDALGIALYALFISLLVPKIKRSAHLITLVIFTALLNAVLGLIIPSSWAIIASCLIGALVGVFFVPDEDDASKETEVAK
ncbi:MAG: AzlC family ABC transporter permease [Clostridia bacterium]|nr:AzlC family ABC transporter permease [Clostridia bacterium]